MKLESKVFRDAANIYLWDGKNSNDLRYNISDGCCQAIWLSWFKNSTSLSSEEYKMFFSNNFRPKNLKHPNRLWWQKGWRFWTQAAVQRHRKKMLLKAADLVDKMNAEER